MDMEKYSERARGFVQTAQTLALREGHQQLTPLHVLKVLLDDAEGLTPRREGAFATRVSHHVYMFRYDEAAFGGLPRERFIEAMNAEGIPVGGAYRLPLHRMGLFQNRDGELARFWPRNDGVPDLDYSAMSCPEAERLCAGETLWLTQSVFLDTHEGMEQVLEAVEKVRDHAGEQLAAS